MTDVYLADLHLTDKPQDEYRWNVLRLLPRLLPEGTITNRLIILGDITDNKDRHSEQLVNKMVNLFAYWTHNWCDDIIILAGNHCGITPERAFFRFLSHMNESVDYITEPYFSNEEGERRELFLPHVRMDVEREWRRYMPFTAEKYDAIYMHQTVQGATAANSLTLKGLSPEIFNDVPMVISGDVHVTQKVLPNIHYVGTPYPINFGDSEVGNMIVHKDDRLFDVSIRSIRKDKLILHRDNYLEELEAVDMFVEDSQYVVNVNISQSDMHEWKTVRNDIRNYILSKRSVPVRIQPVIERVDSTSRRRRRRSLRSSSDVDIVRSHVSAQRLDTFYLQTAIDLIKE